MANPSEGGLSPGYETILRAGVPGELLDRIVSGKTRENKAGLGFFPSNYDLLFSIGCFFESAQRGREQTQRYETKLAEGTAPIIIDFTDINNAIKLQHCLATLKIQQDNLPDVEKGFSGILAKDSEASKKQIKLAKKFTEVFYESFKR